MAENVELVRSIYSGRGPDEHLGFRRWAHPDIEVVSVDGPAPGVWRGTNGLGEALKLWRDAWEDFRAEPEEFRALDSDRVLVLIRRSGRGRTSGLELRDVRTQGAVLFNVHDGQVTRVVNYFERGRAFADLGLAE